MGAANVMDTLTDKRYALEDTLKVKVMKWLSVQPDIYYWKASDRYTKGVSDIIACVNGWFVAAELKADDGEATPHQDLFIMCVNKAKGVGGVCYCLQDVIDLVNEARRRSGANAF